MDEQGQLDWAKLEGGYRLPYDPRPTISVLKNDPRNQEAWRSLWENLHHQGDVGEASYAAIPELYASVCGRGRLDWNVFAISVVIDLCRGKGANPDLPNSVRENYFKAIHDLAILGLSQIADEPDADTARAILAVIALDKGLRTHAHFLLNFTEDELLELAPES